MSWLPKKKVVVPIDFSGISVDAIATATELAESLADVHVVYVVVPLGNLSPGLEWGNIDDQSRLKAVEEHFDMFLNQHGFRNVTTVVRTGDPGTEIAGYAAECQAELIVIPSHGYHGLKRVMLGSVAASSVAPRFPYSFCAEAMQNSLWETARTSSYGTGRYTLIRPDVICVTSMINRVTIFCPKF